MRINVMNLRKFFIIILRYKIIFSIFHHFEYFMMVLKYKIIFYFLFSFSILYDNI